jgi:putative endonuclease
VVKARRSDREGVEKRGFTRNVTHEMKKVKGDEKIGNELGRLGEEIACNFLEKRRFEIIDRNYRKKWGELDVVTKKDGVIHFVEVKSVSCEMTGNVTRETRDSYRPEDNVHPQKVKRLKRAIQTYIAEKGVSPETSWFFNVIVVRIDVSSKKALVRILKDIIL